MADERRPGGREWVYMFAVLGLPTAEHWAWSRTLYMRHDSIASSTMNPLSRCGSISRIEVCTSSSGLSVGRVEPRRLLG